MNLPYRISQCAFKYYGRLFTESKTKEPVSFPLKDRNSTNAYTAIAKQTPWPVQLALSLKHRSRIGHSVPMESRKMTRTCFNQTILSYTSSCFFVIILNIDTMLFERFLCFFRQPVLRLFADRKI